MELQGAHRYITCTNFIQIAPLKIINTPYGVLIIYGSINCTVSCSLHCIGREFKALFISTVECVHDGFKSANPTKSFCNCYVFNTALTRAQSLVVVAGNPFLLLKVEAAMPKPKGCWREYLRRCIDHNTFIVPKHFGNESTILTELKQLVGQPEKGDTKQSFFHCLSSLSSLSFSISIPNTHVTQ